MMLGMLPVIPFLTRHPDLLRKYSMPLPETVETYKYFITEAEKLDLAYITLVRYARQADVEIDGWCLSHSFPTKRELINYNSFLKANYEESHMTS